MIHDFNVDSQDWELLHFFEDEYFVFKNSFVFNDVEEVACDNDFDFDFIDDLTIWDICNSNTSGDKKELKIMKIIKKGKGIISSAHCGPEEIILMYDGHGHY